MTSHTPTSGAGVAGPTDRTIRAGGLPLRVRDHGGAGPPILLLHGAGADRHVWDGIAPRLCDGHRVVAVDMRGHGESGVGPLSWDLLLDDLDAVVDELELPGSAVVGHSVGGLLAARWAAHRPDCRAAVSLDGHRNPATLVTHYDRAAGGLDERALVDAIAGFREWFDELFARVESMASPDRAAASAAARALLEGDDLRSFTGMRNPTLLVVATQSGALIPDRWEPLLTSFRAGLDRDLDALRRHEPHLAVREIDASHGLLTDVPEKVIELVDGFVDGEESIKGSDVRFPR